MTDIEREAMEALVREWQRRVVHILSEALPLAEYIEDTFANPDFADDNSTEITLPCGLVGRLLTACAKVGKDVVGAGDASDV